jgi:hypothetical protein
MTADQPLTSVSACISKAKAQKAGTFTKCYLNPKSIFDKEASIQIQGVANGLSVEPYPDSDASVTFDATDAVENLQVKKGGKQNIYEITWSTEGKGAVDLRSQLVVNGQNTQCAAEHSIGREPCFFFDPKQNGDGWATTYDHERVLGEMTGASYRPTKNANNVPWHFEIEKKCKVSGHFCTYVPHLYVDAAMVAPGETIAKPEDLLKYVDVRVKNPARATSFSLTGGNQHTYFRKLFFRGMAFGGDGPSSSAKGADGWNDDTRIEGCTFLYHPGAVKMLTSSQLGRGAGRLFTFANNKLLFGSAGALYYAASAAVVKGNYMIFNSLENRMSEDFHKLYFFTILASGYRDYIADNTLMYNGEAGSVMQWAKGNTNVRNFYVGQDYLAKFKDAAYIHIETFGQFNSTTAENWLVGPSNVKSIRTDTAITGTNTGRYAHIIKNVMFGTAQGMTIKGNNHYVYHNIGDAVNIVYEWGDIHHHCSECEIRYNAYTQPQCTGTPDKQYYSWPAGEMNLCGANPGDKKLHLETCNPQISLVPGDVKVEIMNSGFDGEVCSEINSCPPMASRAEVSPKGMPDVPEKALHPFYDSSDYEYLLMDPRPKEDSKLLLKGAEKHADFESFVGAYDASASSAFTLPGVFPSQKPTDALNKKSISLKAQAYECNAYTTGYEEDSYKVQAKVNFNVPAGIKKDKIDSDAVANSLSVILSGPCAQAVSKSSVSDVQLAGTNGKYTLAYAVKTQGVSLATHLMSIMRAGVPQAQSDFEAAFSSKMAGILEVDRVEGLKSGGSELVASHVSTSQSIFQQKNAQGSSAEGMIII